jgi:hypothetical protein
MSRAREEALAWTKRFPNPSLDGGEAEIEVRPFFELGRLRRHAGRPQGQGTQAWRLTMPQQIQPYLFFEGRTEEALAFYRSTLDAEVQMMMRYRDGPRARQRCPDGSTASRREGDARCG